MTFNKVSFLILICSGFIFSNNKINEIVTLIHDGKYNFSNNENLLKMNGEGSNYLRGLLELDGDISKDYFLDYYNEYPNGDFAHDAVVKIAEYYYSNGLYKKSSQWYKKIPFKYPDSSHLNKSMSYYLNSLVIMGEVDSAKFYTQKFKNKYPKLNFTNEFIGDHISSPVISKKKTVSKKTKNNIKYSLQIGTYKNYQSAITKKRILSDEGFFSRIDEVYLNNEKMYSVRIGFYNKKSLADREKNRLSSRLGIYDSIIVQLQ